MKKVIRNNLYMLKLFFRAVPGYAISYMLAVILRSILFNLFGRIWLTKYIVGAAGQILADSGMRHGALAELAAVICAYYGFVLLLNTLIEGVLNHSPAVSAEIKVKKVFAELLFEKSCKIDLACYDNTGYYNDLVAAQKESYTRTWQTYRSAVGFCESIILLFSLLYIISTFDIVIFLLAFLIHVISSVCQILLNKVNGEAYRLSVPENKREEYVNRVFFLKQYAKDMKITKISRLLFRELKDSSENRRAVCDKYGLKKAGISCADGLTKKVGGDFCALLYLSYMFLVRQAYGFDVMAALWNAFGLLKGSMNNIAGSVRELHNNSIYIEKFIAFMELENTVVSRKEIITDRTEPVHIEFRNISFSYDQKNMILNHFNLTINAGEKIAIVGNNGAGKSTLFKLLLRLYDPDEGEIYVNGVDIRDYNVDFYRKEICNVLVQDFQQYPVSLYENAKMDFVDAERDSPEIDCAFHMVGLDDKISSLPRKGESQYSREFDEEGVVLSGGERQKLALARVLLHHGNMILLDEPSSALDPKAESEFNDLVFQSIQQKTLIIISHRLSATRMADRIVLMENGQVLEDGDHETLMRKAGKYALMFEMQAGRYR